MPTYHLTVFPPGGMGKEENRQNQKILSLEGRRKRKWWTLLGELANGD
jgi:hypothetical protein